MIFVANLFWLAALHAAQRVEPPPTSSKQVYGTFDIRAWGDTGAYVFPSSPAQKITRRERLVLECTLRFDKDRLTKAPYVVTTIKDFVASIDYTQKNLSTGPIDRIETTISWSNPTPMPPGVGTIFVDQGGSKRVHTSLDATWDATEDTRITTYFRDGREPKEEHRSQMALKMQMPIEIDWTKAEWEDAYNGSFTGMSLYRAYFLNNQMRHWLKMQLKWQLSPLPHWAPEPDPTYGHKPRLGG